MDEEWTCGDLGRALKRPRVAAPAAEPVAADAALLTMAKLLTGAGGAIPDSEVRALEGWLDRQAAAAALTPDALEARAARAEADAAGMARAGRIGCFSHVAALREAREDREAAARLRRG